MFVTFEGIDGSGKTTQITLLKEYLELNGKSVVCVREPGSTVLSESIRAILLESKESIDPISETLLFCAARAQLVSATILPELKSGKIVLCDRYTDSTVVYQGYGRGISIDQIFATNEFATKALEPDITFFLDVPVNQAKKRAEERKVDADRMEGAGEIFFENVRKGYLELLQRFPHRIKYIDGKDSVDNIHSMIIKYIDEL